MASLSLEEVVRQHFGGAQHSSAGQQQDAGLRWVAGMLLCTLIGVHGMHARGLCGGARAGLGAGSATVNDRCAPFGATPLQADASRALQGQG